MADYIIHSITHLGYDIIWSFIIREITYQFVSAIHLWDIEVYS